MKQMPMANEINGMNRTLCDNNAEGRTNHSIDVENRLNVRTLTMAIYIWFIINMVVYGCIIITPSLCSECQTCFFTMSVGCV